jgi:PAS domain S-box-containing protein
MPRASRKGRELMERTEDDLLYLMLELMVYGILLALIMPLTRHRLDGASVATICCFLAAVFVCKVLFLPPRFPLKNFWGRALSIVGCGLFSWWLIYQAENTRMGWYRFHVLQTRIQQLVSKSPAYVVTIDCDGIITGTSDNIGMLTGYRKDELVGQPSRILMRPEVAARHERAIEETVRILRDNDHSPDAGWGLQGNMVVGVKRKDGQIAPVRIFAGGIRWSEDIQFDGDIDLFAVFIPEGVLSAAFSPASTIPSGTPLKQAPPPPQSPILSPMPRRFGPIDEDNGNPLMSRPGSKGTVTQPTPNADRNR